MDGSDSSKLNASSVLKMGINDNKAGMQDIDKEKINAIILKHSQSM
jgi:hypothetical protein